MCWNSIEKGELDPSKIDRGVKYMQVTCSQCTAQISVALYLQVLAMAENVKETYHNLSVINEKLQVRASNTASASIASRHSALHWQ